MTFLQSFWPLNGKSFNHKGHEGSRRSLCLRVFLRVTSWPSWLWF